MDARLQALVQLGQDSETGAALVPLVAGADESTGYRGLTPHFSPHDLQRLLELERQTLAEHLLMAQFQEGEA